MKEFKSPDKKNIDDVLALTPMQEGMLFHYLRDPRSDQYLEQLTLEISGEIDAKVFEKAWNMVVETNEVLRTAFRWEKLQHPIQIVTKKHHLRPVYLDLTARHTGEKNKLAGEIKENDRKKKFDLREIPFRVTLCKLEPTKYQMIVTNHHILYDGWSNGIILKEFFKAYNDLAHQRIPIKPVKNKFKEYIRWLETREKNKQEKFWREYLRGIETPTELAIKMKKTKSALDNKLSEEDLQHTGKYQTRWSREIKNEIEAFVKKHRITLAALFYTSWGILLQKYNNTDDILFGTTVSGRSAKLKGIEDMVGLFINTLPLRVKQDPTAPVTGLLKQVEQLLKAREEYESTSLADINQYSQADNRGELFDSLVVLENYPLDRRLMLENNELSVDSFSMTEVTNYDLAVGIVVFDDLDLDFVYKRECFEPGIIENLSDHFCRLTENIIISPARKVHEIEILSEKEKQQLLVDFNNTTVDYPRDKTIHQLFTEQAEQTPDYIAVTGSLPLKNRTYMIHMTYISYQELNHQSNRLAGVLLEKGINPDTIIGILLERSIDMIIGILGILKAGAAYLPIDPDYPEERINYILSDSKVKFLVKKSNNFSHFLHGKDIPVILIDDFSNKICPKGTPSHPHLPPAPAASLAYIIYTSGSTGKPKGVMVEHQSAVNILFALQKDYPFKKADAYLFKTSVVFDVSVTELFGWFLGDGRLIILEKDGEKDPYKILDAIERMAVTHINFVPSMFNAFLEVLNRQKVNRLTGLKYIFLAGEALLPGVVNKFGQLGTGIRLENIYGPTEGTVYSSKYPLSHWDGRGSIPIGKPMQNIKLYILDKDKHLQPIGVPGELCIAGMGLARGYLNQPQLTSEVFLLKVPGKDTMQPCNHAAMQSCIHSVMLKQNHTPQYPIPPSPHPPIYRSGDLCRWQPDGNIEFLGRIDQQVKIRGFRIETAEIESRIINDPRIRETIVAAKQDQKADRYLCAYIVTNEAVEVSQLKARLAEQLPAYMIPSYFVMLDKLPLTPTGKIDRKALPEPGIKGGKDYSPPRNRIEEKLIGIMSGVLGISGQIGIDDDFFEIGGHSLKATRLTGLIYQSFDIEVTLTRLFKTPTVRGISHYIQNTNPRIHRPIDIAEEKEYYPLSPAQKRLYLLQQMKFNNTSYNIPQVYLIENEPNRGKIESVFKKLIRRHESFRTSFRIINDKPVQQIHKEVEFEIEYYENYKLQITNKAEPHKQALNADSVIPLDETKAHHSSFIIHHSFVRPFDLAHPPLLRVGLVEYPYTSAALHGHPSDTLPTPAALRSHPSREGKGDKYLLMVDMHHIISDGVSMATLIKEFAACYGNAQLPGLQIQYKDYTEWQDKTRDSESVKQQEQYWLKQFGILEEIPVLNLPIDYPRPIVQGLAGETLHFEIGENETAALKSLAFKEETTLFIVLLSCYNVLLSKLASQQDITVGTPIAARRRAELWNIIGMFVNTLVMRNFPYPELSFIEFLKQVKEKTLNAYENQEYPFEDLVEKVNVNRDASRNPLFDVMFVLQNMEIADLEIPGLKLKPYEYENRASKFDMTLITEEKHKKLYFAVEYCTKLFKQETILRFSKYFKKIIYSVLRDPGQEIFEIEIITQEERKQVLYDLNEKGVEYPCDRTIPQLFTQQVKQTPDHIAVVGCSEGTRGLAPLLDSIHLPDPISITYNHLNRKSNQLAYLLKEKGVEPDTIVGIIVDRTLEMIIGILGILKAGGAYLPINPKNPPERIKYMLADSNAQLLVVDDASCASWLSFAPKVFLNLSEGHHLNFPASQFPNFPASLPSSLAYIIYTSGSTGNPKGVPIIHANFSPLVHWEYRHLDIGPGDRAVQILSYYFDWSVLEIFITLTTGASLFMITTDILLNPELLVNFIIEKGITVMHITPTHYQYLINIGKKLESLRYLFLGAEKLTIDLVKRSIHSVTDQCRIFNMYGPTETTIISAVLEIQRPELEAYANLTSIPIGKPAANINLLVLDSCLKPCSIHVVGELYIAGDALAMGYMNDPEKTGQTFIKNIFKHKGIKGERLYKTGDLVRWLVHGADVTVEFLGRKDHQVKIRGLRIELGEIENRLLNHKDVKETLVITREETGKDKCLCAYIVPQHMAAFREAGLREYLAAQLPDYMVPTYFIPLEKMPLNPNGKIDRKALPEPTVTERDNYVPPTNKIQKKLVKIWSDVLARKNPIGINDDFFKLGGHSLMATIMAAHIHRELDVKVPLVEIFNNSSIRKLAAYISKTKKSIYESILPAEKRDYYPQSSAQKRLFLLDKLENISSGYNIPVVLKVEGILEQKAVENVFRTIIARHESLRTSFRLIGSEAVQRVHDKVAFKIEYDRSLVNGHWSLANCQGRGEVPSPIKVQEIIKNFIRPFDLTQAPLLRVGLMELPQDPAAGGGILIMDMHHIAADGTSMTVLLKEFITLHQGKSLSPLNIQYKDFSTWQNQLLKAGKLKTQEQYWQKLFQESEDIPTLNLPADYKRPEVQSFEGKVIKFQIEEDDAARLKTMALKQDVTLYILLLAIYNILLSKLSGQEDIIIGTPTASRRHADLQPLIGMFVNTLALRNIPTGEKSFHIFLPEVKEKTLAAFENQEYPFEDLVEKVSIVRDPGRNPLFDVMFTLQDEEFTRQEIPGIKLTPIELENNISKFDLTMQVVETGKTLLFNLEYCTKLYRKETIDRLIKYFKKIVSAVLDDPDREITQMEILSPEEKHQVLYEFNDTGSREPLDKTLHELYAEQAEQTPDHVALIGSSQIKYRAYRTYMTHISYRELNEKSNRLAHLLIRKGVKPDTIVAMMMDRSIEMIIAIFGILKAGGAYLPIDLEYPEDRINYMLKDSNAQVLVVNNTTCASWLSFGPEPLLNLSEGHHLSFPASQLPRFPASLPSSLAYIIYTSGTTGKPKGNLTTHANVTRVIKKSNYIELTASDRVLQLSNYAFDGSVFDIYGALLNGAVLVLVNRDTVSDTDRLAALVIKRQITVFFVTTALFNTLIDTRIHCFDHVKKVLFGGERVSVEHTRKALEYMGKGRVIHVYGPTETTVYATYYFIHRVDEAAETIPIGKPLTHTTAYILDRYQQPVPIGVTGELYIGGQGLARGYLNRPGLTAEKFCLRRPVGTLSEGTRGLAPLSLKVLNKDYMQSCNHASMQLASPYSPHSPHLPYSIYSPIYQTGDMARWQPDGNIEFIGRIDTQVKIRGFRVELAEIEKNLLTHESVNEALVLAKERQNKDKYLCAYIVPRPGIGNTASPKELRAHLTWVLPHYMIPAYFVQMRQMPLTANGKVDTKALPEPAPADNEPGNTPPTSQVARKLVEIWSHILEIEKKNISIETNFFEKGGHSLNAEILRSRIHKEFNVKLPLVEIFKTPTIRGLTPKIQEAEQSQYTGIESLEKKEYYELSYNQKRLWYLHNLDPTDRAYHIPGWLRFNHRVNIEALQQTLTKIFTRHESFRSGIKKIDGQPVQFIRENTGIPIQTVDISELPGNEKWQKTKEIITQTFARPFDLENPPLFRSILIKQEEEVFLFVYNMHHIISDGWSMGILRREFHRVYNETINGNGNGNQWRPEPLQYRYKDFAAWHNRQIRDTEPRRKALRYWKKLIETGLPTLRLPYYFSGSPGDKSGASRSYTIGQTGKEKLRQLARDNQTTLSTLMYTLYNLLFAYLSGQKEIVTILISAGRVHSSLDMVVGYFINPVIVKIDIDLRGEFEALLSNVQHQLLEALQHQTYPFELVLEDLEIPKPDIPVSFNFISMPDQEIDPGIPPGSRETLHIQEEQEVKFPLGLFLTEYKNGIDIKWDYQKTMFEPGTIENIAGKYLQLVEDVTGIDE
jgi:amino acid adenylation domain-containing protein